MQKILYSLVSPMDTGLKTLEVKLMLKKQAFNNKVIFKEKSVLNFVINLS